MKYIWIFLSLLRFTAAIENILYANTTAACKKLPGDEGWPAPEVWEKAMPGVVARADQDPDATRPDYQLVAASIAQVQAAVKFATDHNVRLSILNSGHDFLARHDSPSGLSLMVGNLKGVRVSERFRAEPRGVPNVNYTTDPVTDVNTIQRVRREAAVTFGVGVTGHQLNTALAKSGLFVVAAAASPVRVAGGYAQAAGHGPLSSRYGLAADNVLEYKVVTSDGRLRIANANSEPDLFWALRGGGGGTFGVVVESTAFPSPKLTMTRWWLKTSSPNDTTSIYDPAAYALSQMPNLNRKNGVQGYFYIYPNEIWIMMLTADEQSGIDKANRTWAPVLDKLASFPGVAKPIHQYQEFPNFESWFDFIFGALNARPKLERFESDEHLRLFARDTAELDYSYPKGHSPMDSRLLGVQHLSNPMLSVALQGAMPQMKSGMLRGHLVAGDAVSRLGADTSVHPAWRKAYIHLIGTGCCDPKVSMLKQLAPDMGAYSNECSYKENDWKSNLYGPHYNKLLSIKRRYDPKNLFWVSPGVGADDFNTDSTTGRVCPASENVKATGTVFGPAPLFDNRNQAVFTLTAYNVGPKSQEAADEEARQAAAKAATST
ncbi:FAD-binding domain-containing protein [Tothia fuscella]|uniref:FAD-binding domain-containing protein n=1 Tax=Tothia fuscella TaxID=1048955 RepID=A0A9P4NMA2_9PEZI|nr:FAD-binding domain-containing protein [Tothia fuscella]